MIVRPGLGYAERRRWAEPLREPLTAVHVLLVALGLALAALAAILSGCAVDEACTGADATDGMTTIAPTTSSALLLTLGMLTLPPAGCGDDEVTPPPIAQVAEDCGDPEINTDGICDSGLVCLYQSGGYCAEICNGFDECSTVDGSTPTCEDSICRFTCTCPTPQKQLGPEDFCPECPISNGWCNEGFCERMF